MAILIESEFCFLDYSSIIILFPIFSVTGCRSNNECANQQACLNKECKDPCGDKSCARSEKCVAQDHIARCKPSK